MFKLSLNEDLIMNIERFKDIDESLKVLGYVDCSDEEIMEYMEMGGMGCKGIMLDELGDVDVGEMVIEEYGGRN